MVVFELRNKSDRRVLDGLKRSSRSAADREGAVAVVEARKHETSYENVALDLSNSAGCCRFAAAFRNMSKSGERCVLA